jgi:hypothetical protein
MKLLKQNELYISTLKFYLIEIEKSSASVRICKLRRSNINLDKIIYKNIEIESGESNLSVFNYLNVVVDFKDYSHLLPGDHVIRMGRNGWHGRILKAEVDSVLVDWGSHKEWLERFKVYPSDRFGNPINPGKAKNIAKVAKRARFTLETDKTFGNSAIKINQLQFY